MADATGTFEAKHTGNTYSRTAEGDLVINAHFEGERVLTQSLAP